MASGWQIQGRTLTYSRELAGASSRAGMRGPGTRPSQRRQMRKGLQEAVEEKHQPWPRTWAEQEAPISGKKKVSSSPWSLRSPTSSQNFS